MHGYIQCRKKIEQSFHVSEDVEACGGHQQAVVDTDNPTGPSICLLVDSNEHLLLMGSGT